ncbi:Dtw domain-containing protein 1-like, partial [Plakobranchus ocellatus]
LPITVDIIKHPSEIDGKSTSCHAAVLAPDDVTVFTYPCIPDYDPKETVLVFPCDDSISLEDLRIKFEMKDKATAESTTLNMPLKSSDLTKAKDSSLNSASSNTPGCQIDLMKHDCTNLAESNIGRKRAAEQTSEELPTKCAKLKKCRMLPFKKVVFIDSTWNQTRNIVHDERLKGE